MKRSTKILVRTVGNKKLASFEIKILQAYKNLSERDIKIILSEMENLTEVGNNIKSELLKLIK